MKTWMVIGLAVAVAAADCGAMTFSFDPEATTGTHVSHEIYGMNMARWDHQLFPSTSSQMLLTADTDAIRKLKALDLPVLKYPGGNDADSYIWNSPANPPADMDTDEFLALAATCGAAGFFTVNYTQPPALAAEWVRYVNAPCRRAASVPYWEVGDEVWGRWAKSHSTGADYGRRFREFASAMKAVDPTIELAANLHLGNPDTSWTQDALSELGDSFEIVTITFFAQASSRENDAQLLKAPDNYRERFNRLKSYVARRRESKTPVKYCLVGFNSVGSHPGPQSLEMVNAVYMAQMYGAMAETGTDMACWWAFHNEWRPRGGDYGILTSTPENRPYYTYHVLNLLSHKFHGELLASERRGDVEFYATRNTSGSICALLINKSTAASEPVTVAPAGARGWTIGAIDSVTSATGNLRGAAQLKPDSPAQQWDGDRAVMPAQFQSLEPYSVNVIMLEPDGA